METEAAGDSQELHGASVNRFELQVHVADPSRDIGMVVAPYLITRIWVDGAHLDEPHPIHLPLLIQSLHEPGAYDIFTCDCGEGGCAGIFEGIHVTHEGELVHWDFRRPQSAEQIGPDMDAWWDIATPVHLTFRRSQMMNAVQSYLGEIRAIAGDNPDAFDWPVAAISVRTIMGIDPTKPYYGGR